MAARDVLDELGVDVPLWISVTIVDLSGRTLSGQTLEAFWASVEHARPADRRGQLLARRARDAPPRGGARAARRLLHELPPERRPAERLRRLDEGPETTSSLLREFAESGLVNVVGGCCGTTPDHTRAIAAAIARHAAAPGARRTARSRASAGSSRSRSPRTRTSSWSASGRTSLARARFRRLIEANDFKGALDVALDQVRGGANILDVNMDADLLDSEAAMTTFLNLVATEPEVARLPIMVDSSRWSVIEAGLKCVQGKGIVNSISLKEGEEDFLAKARVVRRYGAGGRGHGLRRAGPGRDGRAQGGDLRARLPSARRRGRLPARGHRLRPEHPRGRDRDRGARRVRQGVHRGDAAASRSAARARRSRRDLQPVLRLPRQRGGARGDPLGLPLPRHPGRARHGDRERGPARGLRGHPARPAGARRGHRLQPAAGRDRAHGRVRGHGARGGHEARARPLLARGAGGEAARLRARPRHRRLHRGGHRGGAAEAAAAARRDRGPAHGRDVDRRRPLRLREDVPAAGGEERAGDEAGGRLPRAVHGGREAGGNGRGAREDRAGHGQGGRARHRQEHRRRRARLQQLRGHRPRRHGLRPTGSSTRRWRRAATSSASPA